MPSMIHPSCRGSSLGTRVGSTGKIPRLNSPRNGRDHDYQDQRRGRAAVRQRASSSCFSTFEGLCTMNLPRPDCERRVLIQCSLLYEGGRLAKKTLIVARGQLAAP